MLNNFQVRSFPLVLRILIALLLLFSVFNSTKFLILALLLILRMCLKNFLQVYHLPILHYLPMNNGSASDFDTVNAGPSLDEKDGGLH